MEDLAPIEPMASVKILTLPVGTYKITVTEGIDPVPLTENLTGPVLKVSAAPVYSEGSLEIMSGPGTFENWLRHREDSVIARIHGGTASVLLTSVRMPDMAAMSIDIRLLDADEAASISHELDLEWSGDESPTPAVPMTLAAHIHGVGAAEFVGGKIESTARTAWIEGFEIRLAAAFPAPILEYCAVHADGIITPWLDNNTFCGTRGKGPALTGFALRVKPQLSHAYDCAYSATFASGHRCDSLHDGALCQSAVPDDPLVSMEVKLFELHATAQGAPGAGTAIAADT
jgi:hypothetical protein